LLPGVISSGKAGSVAFLRRPHNECGTGGSAVGSWVAHNDASLRAVLMWNAHLSVSVVNDTLSAKLILTVVGPVRLRLFVEEVK